MPSTSVWRCPFLHKKDISWVDSSMDFHFLGTSTQINVWNPIRAIFKGLNCLNCSAPWKECPSLSLTQPEVVFSPCVPLPFFHVVESRHWQPGNRRGKNGSDGGSERFLPRRRHLEQEGQTGRWWQEGQRWQMKAEEEHPMNVNALAPSGTNGKGARNPRSWKSPRMGGAGGQGAERRPQDVWKSILWKRNCHRSGSLARHASVPRGPSGSLPWHASVPPGPSRSYFSHKLLTWGFAGMMRISAESVFKSELLTTKELGFRDRYPTILRRPHFR